MITNENTLVLIPDELLLDCYIFIKDMLDRPLPPIPMGEAQRLHSILDELITEVL